MASLKPNRLFRLLILGLCLCQQRTIGADWVQAGLHTNQPLWGIKGGLQFAIHPAGFRGPEGGPRGLIRLGCPVLENGGYDLVNFIAVEPVVNGKKGYSELERSQLDQVHGKRFVTIPEPNADSPQTMLQPGRLWEPAPGVEQLDIIVGVEKFENGAHLRVTISQRSDAPDEIKFTLHTEPDSAPLEYCILTATMGNMLRTRQLWLKDEVIQSTGLYPEYKESGFAPHSVYPLAKLFKTTAGDILVAITTDEQNPSAVLPFSVSNFWHYKGAPVTQYWKKPNGTFRDGLKAAVNARYTYWQSKQPIPGGIAFENFELREPFYERQQFIFGITRKSPINLGFKSRTLSSSRE